MNKTLLLVESPTKAKKLQSFLGDNYVVQATFGHMLDLPPKDLGIDLETMEENYVVLENKGRIDYNQLIKKIQQLAKDANRVLIASDPDREGEAIAWHVQTLLKLQDPQYDRIVLNEITKKGLEHALQARRKIDRCWVDAQRARRVIDRLMGYGISPVLMRTIDNARSAGRVQSAALRMIVERDREHEKFKPEDRYSVEGHFSQNSFDFKTILLQTTSVLDYATPVNVQDDEADEQDRCKRKKFISDKPLTELIVAITQIPADAWSIVSVKSHSININPKPPLITSTLQQLGSRRYGWTGEQTMKVAQKLFEYGYITYMRTDSVRISEEATENARSYIATYYGVDMIPDTPNVFKNKDAAQDAHEAIRPTQIETKSNEINIEEDKNVNNIDVRMLYDAIREIFLCSQASTGTNTVTTATVEDTKKKFQFETSLTVWNFPGWRTISQEEPRPSGKLKVQQGPTQFLHAEETKTQTRPKPRYKEDSLIQDLEKNGIGRPSSYASILKILNLRTYVNIKGKDLISTELGRQTTDWLIGRASHYTDIHYTAHMEERLDLIAAGKQNKMDIMQEVRDDLKKTFNSFKAHGTGEPSLKQKEFLNKIKEGGEIVPNAAYQTINGAHEFLNAYMVNKKPSEKQVQFALNLAQRTGMEYNDTMQKSAPLTKTFIDDALIYAQKHKIQIGGDTDKPATEKQIIMAKKLAATQNIIWNQDLEQSMRKISEFIDTYMNNHTLKPKNLSGDERPASEKQIAMAESLAKKHGVDYPPAYKKSMAKTSDFISKHLKK